MDSIVVVAHGSPEDLNGDAAQRYAESLTQKLGQKVHYAYKGDIEPTIRSVLNAVAEEKPDRLVVLPLFFAPGIFADRIVPAKIGLPQGSHRGRIDLNGHDIEIVIAEAFGIQPAMRNVMAGVLRKSVPADGRTTVVLIGHGSKDKANENTVEMNAEYVKAMGYETISCYNEFCEPTVEQGMAMALATGSDSILVIPMFVSSSHHSVVEIPEKIGLAAGKRTATIEVEGRRVNLIYETEIGLAPGIGDLLADMYEGL